jgi:hypothetical protein
LLQDCFNQHHPSVAVSVAFIVVTAVFAKPSAIVIAASAIVTAATSDAIEAALRIEDASRRPVVAAFTNQ